MEVRKQQQRAGSLRLVRLATVAAASATVALPRRARRAPAAVAAVAAGGVAEGALRRAPSRGLLWCRRMAIGSSGSIGGSACVAGIGSGMRCGRSSSDRNGLSDLVTAATPLGCWGARGGRAARARGACSAAGHDWRHRAPLSIRVVLGQLAPVQRAYTFLFTRARARLALASLPRGRRSAVSSRMAAARAAMLAASITSAARPLVVAAEATSTRDALRRTR